MRTKEMTMIALLVAILIASQFALSVVVGVNLVFPLLIIYAYTLGFKRTMLIMVAFVGARFLIGLPLMTAFLWLWTFTVLVVLAHVVNKASKGNEYVAAIFSFGYFVLFGLMCAVQEYFITEVPILVYWMKGVPSDLLGAVSGFVSIVVLLAPIRKAITFSLEEQQNIRPIIAKQQVQE